nr:hypothetical protein [Nocardia carnea]
MISLEDWAEIRYLHDSEGLSQRAIAKRLGIFRDTVARAIASQNPPRYSRVSGPSAFDAFEPHVRELLVQFPGMPASVLADRVGSQGSPSWFRKKVARLLPEYAPKDPADRLSYRPGDQAQCDLWFPPVRVPVGAGQWDSPPVLVMVASFSRFRDRPDDPVAADTGSGGGYVVAAGPTAQGGSAEVVVEQRSWYRPGEPAGRVGGGVHRDDSDQDRAGTTL